MSSKHQSIQDDYFKQEEKRIARFFRCKRVVQSCNTTEQLTVAFRYCMYYLQQVHHPKTPDTNPEIWEEIKRFCGIVSERSRELNFDALIKDPDLFHKAVDRRWVLTYFGGGFKVDYVSAIDFGV